MTSSAPHIPQFRIGQGYDVHALVEGRKLILGGVHVPSDQGLLGHSDADALLHALTDALLGAAGLGDIGKHFPDTDARYAGINSRLFLSEAAQHVRNAGYEVGNIDATIIAQAPKMAPHLPQMVANVSTDCGITPEQINLKAKTNEKLGWEGRQEGMAAQVVALIFRI
jgi:2-C-methyl-D-erythritol 2,4-cyclodiphosphate synthase